MKRLLLIISGLVLFIHYSDAQGTPSNPDEWAGQGLEYNTITTAVPFINIGPDARSGGMGELGAGTEPDAMSMHWNPAKYAFIDKKFGFSVSYSPWLKKLVPDINLAYVTGYLKIGDKQTVAGSLKFFSLGEIAFTDKDGYNYLNARPNEFSIDGTYSRKFSQKLSGAVAARFIYSNLTQGQEVEGTSTKPGTSVAADIAMYYKTDMNISWLEYSEFTWGVNISNIGAKISYSNDDLYKDFIPTNFRIGPSWLLGIDDYNSIRFSIDINKLLVPTPPVYAVDSSGQTVLDDSNNPVIVPNGGMDPNVSVVQGMIQSWYDAPGKYNTTEEGEKVTSTFQEEMQEFIWVVGLEYWYAEQFSVRGGYFHESKYKGGRQFFTLGVGLRYNVFGLDFSYLIPTDQQNPLANTLRFTLTFDFMNVKD
ncbi:MAG: type IX secretion system outer membrane channel protein PorV [Bacteroidales bacterium]|nr:type IX secretion system outer membrane channel protein PorV [Bacteroidales bacterium]